MYLILVLFYLAFLGQQIVVMNFVYPELRALSYELYYSENIINLPLTLLYHLLLVPGITELFCHFMAFKGLHLGFLRRLGQVLLDQALSCAQIILTVLLAPADYVHHLAVQCLLYFLVDLFISCTFLNRSRFSLYSPELRRIFHYRIFSQLLVFLISIMHLLFPNFTVLSLDLSFMLKVSLQFLIVLFYLVFKFLLLTDEIIDFFGKILLDYVILVIFLALNHKRVFFKQSESIHAHVRDTRAQVGRIAMCGLELLDVGILQALKPISDVLTLNLFIKVAIRIGLLLGTLGIYDRSRN